MEGAPDGGCNNQDHAFKKRATSQPSRLSKEFQHIPPLAILFWSSALVAADLARNGGSKSPIYGHEKNPKNDVLMGKFQWGNHDGKLHWSPIGFFRLILHSLTQIWSKGRSKTGTIFIYIYIYLGRKTTDSYIDSPLEIVKGWFPKIWETRTRRY